MDDVFQPIPTRGFLVSKEIEAKMDQKPSELQRMIEQFDPGITSLLLKTYGSFTFDRQQYDKILQAASNRGMLVFAANPFPAGRSDHDYAETQYVVEKGAVPIYMMPHAAEMKLKIANSVYGQDNPDAIRAFMTVNNYVGEQPDVWTPPIRTASTVVRNYGQPSEALVKRRLLPYPSK